MPKPSKNPSTLPSSSIKSRRASPQATPPSLRCYGYVRVSTEEQAREGISLDAQEERITAYAAAMGLDLVEIIRDEGVSGKSIDRPGLNRLLEMTSSDEPDGVIVYKLDRLTRRTSDLLHLVEEVFEQGNTRFFSITEQIDTDSAMGKFFLTIMGAMAQMERELISERTKAALAYKLGRGETVGHLPFGYDRGDEGQLVPNVQEKKILRKIQRLRRQGLSYAKIAERLNADGHPTKRGPQPAPLPPEGEDNSTSQETPKNRWHASSVYNVLNRSK